ncbi:hypothetical protein N9H93_02665 [Rhizobiaceae bacterium]|nr:hypothetical protein [Rhizobiaceae bacterium]
MKNASGKNTAPNSAGINDNTYDNGKESTVTTVPTEFVPEVVTPACDEVANALDVSKFDAPDNAPEIEVYDIDRMLDEVATRIQADTVETVAHAAINKALAKAEDETTHSAADRQYLSTSALGRQYVRNVPGALVEAAVGTTYRQDPVLGELSRLTSICAGIPKRDGDLLATATGLALASHPDLYVFREVRIPITHAAIEMVKAVLDDGGDPGEIDRTFRPTTKDGPAHNADMIVFDRRTGTVWVLESKRGGGPNDCGAAKRTTIRLHAIRVCLKPWLEALGIAGVTAVRVAVVDHYGQSSFPEGLKIVGGTFDKAFGIRGLDEAMVALQAELEARTKAAVWPVLLDTVRVALRERGTSVRAETSTGRDTTFSSSDVVFLRDPIETA